MKLFEKISCYIYLLVVFSVQCIADKSQNKTTQKTSSNLVDRQLAKESAIAREHNGSATIVSIVNSDSADSFNSYHKSELRQNIPLVTLEPSTDTLLIKKPNTFRIKLDHVPSKHISFHYKIMNNTEPFQYDSSSIRRFFFFKLEESSRDIKLLIDSTNVVGRKGNNYYIKLQPEQKGPYMLLGIFHCVEYVIKENAIVDTVESGIFLQEFFYAK